MATTRLQSVFAEAKKTGITPKPAHVLSLFGGVTISLGCAPRYFILKSSCLWWTFNHRSLVSKSGDLAQHRGRRRQ
jgi:hypothetical protein